VIYFARGWAQSYELTNTGASLVKRLASRVFAVSQATRHTIITRGITNEESTFVVQNAIDTPASVSLEKRSGLMVCGGFLPSKGHHVAVEVLRNLHAKGINSKLSLVGPIYVGGQSQKYFDHVKKMVENYDLNDYVEFAIDVNNVPDRMKRTSYLLHPSKTEGLPRVVLEAMSYGSIVIANAVGGVTDFVSSEFTGILVNHNSIKEYTEAVISLEKDVDKQIRLRKTAFKKIGISYNKELQIKAFLSGIEKH